MSSALAPIVEVKPSMPADAVVRQMIQVLSSGGVIAFPTDTLYGIGCELGRAQAIERIQRMRDFDGAKRPLTFLLPDIGELPHYATLSESAYRILSRIFPGPYCAELPATNRVPTPFLHEERKTIGVRVPDHAVPLALLAELGQPMISATLQMPGDDEPMNDPAEIRARLEKQLDLVVDGGPAPAQPTTVIDLTGGEPELVRLGRGDVERFGLSATL